MIAATWVLAVATSILAVSGPIALFAWISARRADREQRKRDQQVRMEDRIIKRAKEEFAPRSWGTDLAGWGVLGLAVVALIGWANRATPQNTKSA